MGVDPPPTLFLEFLTTTSLPYRGVDDDESRRIVRSHAIRDANRRKRLGIGLEDKIRDGGAPKPAPQSNFTTKFRLDKKSSKQSPKTKSLSKKNVTNEEHGFKEHVTLGNLQKWRRQPLSIVPSAGDVDPFETLPIRLGPKQQALMHYQSVFLKQNAFSFYAKEKLFICAASDPAWLNATLSLIALHFDLKIGNAISQECLFHRGEALRLVNERLAVSPHNVTNATIGAIASLANFDITNGLLSSATMHISGLEQILADRGESENGLLILRGNDLLQKIVAWSDLSYSTAWDLTPRFPLIRTVVCTASLPEFLRIFAQDLLVSNDITSPHDLFGEMTEIFQTLRLLSLVMSKPYISSKDQDMFTRGLYITEYKLLVLLDQHSEEDVILLDRNSHIYGSTRLAAYLYLYIALRELPRMASIVYTLARRLKGVLEVNNADLVVVWKDDIHLLLWILFIGGTATLGTKERDYFVANLKRVAVHMALKTLESFQTALKEVLWMGEFCEGECASLWKEMRSDQ